MAMVQIRQDCCKGCRYCVEACPRDVLRMSQELNVRGVQYAEMVDGKKCNGCTLCAVICPDVVIEVYK